MPSPYVIQVDLNIESKLRASLEEQDFEINEPVNTLFQAKKKGVTCTLYASGKLMVQGRDMEEFITYFLEPEILGTFTYGYETIDESARIGVDESGKGDFFGPLCVAGVFAKRGSVADLKKLGVKDSKKLNDPLILKIADKIQKNYPTSIVKINPEKYNELYQKFRNLNSLLGWGHATVIDNLLSQVECEYVIIDQFAGEHVVENALKKKKRDVKLVQRTKGEEDLVVAAASIVARAAFVRGIEQLGKMFDLKLPKGANHMVLSTGKQLVSRHGREALGKVGKLHFKTSQEILEG